VGGAGGCPSVGAGIVSPAGVEIAAVVPAPNDHLAAGPHCSVKVSGTGHTGGADGCPTVGPGIVSPTGVQIEIAAPNDHLIAGPDSCVTTSPLGRVGRGRG